MYIIIGYFLFSIYIASLIFFIIGIFNIPSTKNLLPSSENISIIVCVRNGESSIYNILSDLKNQNYKGDLEFIIVDDNSRDGTKKIIYNFCNEDSRFKYLSTANLSSNLKHKKKAINLGIEKAQYEWLLFTDVDCRVKDNWVNEMSKHYKYSDYVIGLSRVEENKSFVSKFQSIDFNMLMISASSSVFMNSPLACSGQNQSYKKSIFEKVNGFSEISDLLQGDDSIFLQLCRKIKNIKISFSTDFCVIAKTHLSWKDFILQRVRWAGDANIMWKFNKLFFLIILCTFHSNLFILYLLFKKMLFPFICLMGTKFIFENIIYSIGNKKLNQKTRVVSFLLWFIIQIPYVVFMGLGSFFVSQLAWRGRKNN